MAPLLSLTQAAEATGQSVARLRSWCATGRLSCEHEDGAWCIPVAALPDIRALVEEHDRAVDAGEPAALIVPVSRATPDLAAEICRRLGLPAGTVTTSLLALDDREYVLAVWKAGGSVGLGRVAELAAELGGDLLDDEGQAH